jgi:hypothetical protein
MQGDERVRYCGQCELNVYNLSGMNRAQAERLVQSHRASDQRLCVRFYQRHDGTVLTKDCPVGLRALRRSVVHLAGRCAAFGLMLVAMVTGCRSRTVDPEPTPLQGEPAPLQGAAVLAPELIEIMGDVCPQPLMGRVATPPLNDQPAGDSPTPPPKTPGSAGGK